MLKFAERRRLGFGARVVLKDATFGGVNGHAAAAAAIVRAHLDAHSSARVPITCGPLHQASGEVWAGMDREVEMAARLALDIAITSGCDDGNSRNLDGNTHCIEFGAGVGTLPGKQAFELPDVQAQAGGMLSIPGWFLLERAEADGTPTALTFAGSRSPRMPAPA